MQRTRLKQHPPQPAATAALRAANPKPENTTTQSRPNLDSQHVGGALPTVVRHFEERSQVRIYFYPAALPIPAGVSAVSDGALSLEHRSTFGDEAALGDEAADRAGLQAAVGGDSSGAVDEEDIFPALFVNPCPVLFVVYIRSALAAPHGRLRWESKREVWVRCVVSSLFAVSFYVKTRWGASGYC